MNVRISKLSAIAALIILGLLGSAQSFAQNAYITNEADGTVSVIDTKTDRVIATISVADHPYAVAISADDNRVYVTDDSGIEIINSASNKVIRRIALPGLTGTFLSSGLVVSPDGSKLYVSNPNNNLGNITVINVDTLAVEATIPLPITSYPGSSVLGPVVYPLGLAITPDGKQLYAAASQIGRVPFAYGMAIDTRTDNYTTFGLPGNDAEMAVSSDGARLYVVANPHTLAVPFYSTAPDHTQLGFLPVPFPSMGGFGLAISPDGSRIYMTAEGPTLMVFDAGANTLLKEIPIPSAIPVPGGVAVTPDGREIYVVNPRQNSVAVVDAATYAITTTIPVGHDPVAFGNFIQAAPKFAGKPGSSNCYGVGIAALAREFGGLAAAAQNYPSVSALQDDVIAFCEG
jgi:YVTN family beta-propeller protein